jgi:hypothetical protein
MMDKKGLERHTAPTPSWLNESETEAAVESARWAGMRMAPQCRNGGGVQATRDVVLPSVAP